MEQNQSGFDRNQLHNVQSWRRSRSDRMVAGVCGGIGRALNVDPVLVRVVMAVLIVSGPGILFYAAGWILMPDEGSDKAPVDSLLGRRVRPDHPWLWPVVLGICVFVGIVVMSSFDSGKLISGPVVVVVLVLLFISRNKRKNTNNDSPWSRMNTPQYGPPPPPAGTSSSATRQPQDRTVESVQPVWTEDDPLGLYVDEPPAAAPAATRIAESPVKGVRGVKPAVVALTGLAIAIGWLAGAATTTVLAIGLATLGAGMLVGGFIGRTMALLPLGILLALGVAAGTIFPNVPRDFKDVNVVATPDQPVTSTSNNYTFDAGAVHLDLTNTTFAPGAHVTINGGAGEVVLKVPANVDVSGSLSAQTGEVVGLEQRQGGHDAKVTLNDLGADGKAGPEAVVVDVRLKLGSIRVERG